MTKIISNKVKVKEGDFKKGQVSCSKILQVTVRWRASAKKNVLKPTFNEFLSRSLILNIIEKIFIFLTNYPPNYPVCRKKSCFVFVENSSIEIFNLFNRFELNKTLRMRDMSWTRKQCQGKVKEWNILTEYFIDENVF